MLAWRQAPSMGAFDLSAYFHAAPYRAFASLLVLVVDVVLGLRWLNPTASFTRQKKKSQLAGTTPADAFEDNDIDHHSLLVRRDRGTMLGHLFWQHWRQSRTLMLGMALLGPIILIPTTELLLSYLSPNLGIAQTDLIPCAILATLVGSMVFLPDQGRRNFHFFAEHNVPPRYVWVTRQIPWLVVLTFLIAVVCQFVASHIRTPDFWQEINRDAFELLFIPQSTRLFLPFLSELHG